MKILLILDAISLKKNAQLFSVNKELLLIQPRSKDLPLYSPEVHTFAIKLDFLANAFRRRLEFGCTVYNLCDRIMRAHECFSQVNWSLIVVSKKNNIRPGTILMKHQILGYPIFRQNQIKDYCFSVSMQIYE